MYLIKTVYRYILEGGASWSPHVAACMILEGYTRCAACGMHLVLCEPGIRKGCSFVVSVYLLLLLGLRLCGALLDVLLICLLCTVLYTLWCAELKMLWSVKLIFSRGAVFFFSSGLLVKLNIYKVFTPVHINMGTSWAIYLLKNAYRHVQWIVSGTNYIDKKTWDLDIANLQNTL